MSWKTKPVGRGRLRWVLTVITRKKRHCEEEGTCILRYSQLHLCLTLRAPTSPNPLPTVCVLVQHLALHTIHPMAKPGADSSLMLYDVAGTPRLPASGQHLPCVGCSSNLLTDAHSELPLIYSATPLNIHSHHLTPLTFFKYSPNSLTWHRVPHELTPAYLCVLTSSLSLPSPHTHTRNSNHPQVTRPCSPLNLLTHSPKTHPHLPTCMCTH